MTGRTGDTVHRHGRVFSVTGRSKLDDQTHEVQRSIISREVPERRQRDRTRSVDDDRTQPKFRSARALNGRDDRTRLVRRDQRPDSSRKLGFVPNGYFLSGAYK